MSKMKLEDQNYLTLKAVEEAKKIDRLQSTLHLGSAPSIAGGGSGSHTLFLDDEDAVKNFDAVEHFDTVPELVGRAHDRPRKSALATARIIGPTDQVQHAVPMSFRSLQWASVRPWLRLVWRDKLRQVYTCNADCHYFSICDCRNLLRRLH